MIVFFIIWMWSRQLWLRMNQKYHFYLILSFSLWPMKWTENNKIFDYKVISKMLQRIYLQGFSISLKVLYDFKNMYWYFIKIITEKKQHIHNFLLDYIYINIIYLVILYRTTSFWTGIASTLVSPAFRATCPHTDPPH